MSAVPKITLDFDWSTAEHVLIATSFGMTSPAGPRLFRGGMKPDIGFRSTDEAEARKWAEILQKYLDEHFKVPGKRNKTNVEERA